jgi:serine/threonine-protein kinase
MPLRDDIAERAQARVGTVLNGKWRLDRVLGIGGMASVYAATHRNQSRCAIKMLHPEVGIDREVTARFLREGYVANSVGHPGAVTVHDDDVSEEGAAFLVMELLEGETLEARWSRACTALPLREVLAFVDRLLDVLVAAHARDIVHRDLKPENLFLTRDGQLKVLDFGIARLRELSGAGTPGTRAGSLLGTPAFMAPEQARGRWDEVDGRTDLWAVGATAFTLLSGRHVHEAETANEQLILAATVPAPSLAAVLPDLPGPFAEMFDRALAFDKAQRFADARAMQRALREAREATGDSAPLSLPRQVSLHEELPTLIAPSEISEVGELPKNATLNSAPAITGTLAGAPARGRRRLGVLLGGAGVLGAAVLLAAIGMRSPAEAPEPATAASLAAQSPRADPSAASGKPRAAMPPPGDTPVTPAPVLPVTEPEPPAARKPAGRPKPVTAAKSGNPASPSAAPPVAAPAKPAASVNPFDLRH